MGKLPKHSDYLNWAPKKPWCPCSSWPHKVSHKCCRWNKRKLYCTQSLDSTDALASNRTCAASKCPHFEAHIKAVFPRWLVPKASTAPIQKTMPSALNFCSCCRGRHRGWKSSVVVTCHGELLRMECWIAQGPCCYVLCKICTNSNLWLIYKMTKVMVACWMVYLNSMNGFSKNSEHGGSAFVLKKHRFPAKVTAVSRNND